MTRHMKKFSVGLAVMALTVPQAAFSQGIDFGDDRGAFARDGECDDLRFEGRGMTSTPLLQSDVRHDATDCRTAYNQGRITLRSSNIIWGDDRGAFANDGECDDMRFSGPGMTSTTLLESDIKHDATDCRRAYEAGRLQLR